MHELLMLLTASLPMKSIEVGGLPYLERYHVKTDPDGTQHWMHRFLRNDSERHLHSHPWTATSRILCGYYVEELPNDVRVAMWPDSINEIAPEKLHRIVEVEPNTWSYMIVKPERLLTWAFISDSGARTPVLTSPPDWWKDCKTRENVN